MAKKNEVSQAVESLKTVQEIIAEVLANLEKPAEAKQEPALSLAEIRAKLAEKSREGHTDEIRDLFIKHGGTRLSEIDPKEYRSLMTEAEAL